MKILLAITFVYGVLRLLTFTKLFDIRLTGILESIVPIDEDSGWHGIFNVLGIWFFYFSLVFQTWYWLFQ